LAFDVLFYDFWQFDDQFFQFSNGVYFLTLFPYVRLIFPNQVHTQFLIDEVTLFVEDIFDGGLKSSFCSLLFSTARQTDQLSPLLYYNNV
jgi:hypothetical protein